MQENNKKEIKTILPDKYPGLLSSMKKIPPHINYIGKIPDNNMKFLCIIGSRQHSDYGKNVCRKIISGLSGLPIVIVSGLAIGIDSVAHELALEYGIKTIAFPGSGLNNDVIYPHCHKKLADRILESDGALFSPFANDQKATIWTFPNRNKLMAGMSHATLVIEARRKSGTLITASHALEYERDVFAVPGSIFSDLSYGPHMLINLGAHPVTSADDIKKLFLFSNNENSTKDISKNNSEKTNIELKSLDPQEKLVAKLLQSSSMNATEIAIRTQLPPSTLNAVLTRLEIMDYIKEDLGVYTFVA
jgi:DNA processing protein